MRRRVAALTGAGLVLALGVFAWGALYEARRVVLERVTVPGPGPRLLIAQISDVDFRGLGPRERRVQELLRDAKPDLIVVTGDLLEFRGGRGRRYLSDAISFLQGLPAQLGILWVVGESERYHVNLLREAIEGTRVRLLYNEEIVIPVKGRTVSIFGLGAAHARFEAAQWNGRPAILGRSAGLFSPLVDASPGAERWMDYDVTGLLAYGDDEDYVGILAYVPAIGDGGYALVRHRDRRAFHLRSFGSGGSLLDGESLNGPAFPPGSVLAYRLRVESGPAENRLRARLWPSGEPEPEDWQLEGRDSSGGRPTGGAAGVCVKGGASERLFSPWRVTSVHDGEPLGGRDLVDFEPTDGTWRSDSDLREWAGGASGPADNRLLLAHNPDVVLTLEAQGAAPVDLILSGHTQGGQIRLPWVGALYTGTELGREFASGMVAPRGRAVYINRGLGTSLIPLRILCPPEVTLLSIPLGEARSSR